MTWESRDLDFSPTFSTGSSVTLEVSFHFSGAISLARKCKGIRLNDLHWPLKNTLSPYNQQQSFPLMCCYNYSPEELPTHVPFLGKKPYSLAARPEDESPTQHERLHYRCSWDSSLKRCPRCLLQRRIYPTLRQWRFAALKAETLPRSRSGPSRERNYPCSSKDTYTQEPYSVSPTSIQVPSGKHFSLRFQDGNMLSPQDTCICS